jgi:hypothetical protein
MIAKTHHEGSISVITSNFSAHKNGQAKKRKTTLVVVAIDHDENLSFAAQMTIRH